MRSSSLGVRSDSVLRLPEVHPVLTSSVLRMGATPLTHDFKIVPDQLSHPPRAHMYPLSQPTLGLKVKPNAATTLLTQPPEPLVRPLSLSPRGSPPSAHRVRPSCHPGGPAGPTAGAGHGMSFIIFLSFLREGSTSDLKSS